MSAGTVTITIRPDVSRFIAAMKSLGRAASMTYTQVAEAMCALTEARHESPARRARRFRRLSGFHPEQPHRSAMHTAYRAKTRRRGRR